MASLTVTVTQAGREVTLLGTIHWPDSDPEALWDDGLTGTIDERGVCTLPPAEDFTDEDCGRVTYHRRRLVFGLSALTLRLEADTAYCGPFEFDAELARL